MTGLIYFKCHTETGKYNRLSKYLKSTFSISHKKCHYEKRSDVVISFLMGYNYRKKYRRTFFEEDEFTFK